MDSYKKRFNSHILLCLILALSLIMSMRAPAYAEGTAGYQLQYGTNKSFKAGTYKTVTIKGNATTKKTVSKLKSKKKYYVRVRTYCVINDENVYSAWSASKNVKVK